MYEVFQAWIPLDKTFSSIRSPKKTLFGRRPSLSTGFQLQEDEPHLTGSYYYGRPKRVSKRKDSVLRTLVFINKEEDSSKEAPDLSELTQQSSYTHTKRTADSYPPSPSLQNKESLKPKDTVSHLTIAQIAEMHPYDTNIKMEL